MNRIYQGDESVHVPQSLATTYFRSTFPVAPVRKRILWNHNTYRYSHEEPQGSLLDRLKAAVSIIPTAVRSGLSIFSSSFAPSTSISTVCQQAFGRTVAKTNQIFRREMPNLTEIANQMRGFTQGRDIPRLLAKHPLINIGEDLTTAGLAIIAAQLRKKTDQSHLFVCQTLSAFRQKLQSIVDSDEDQRVALIVPSHQSLLEPNKRANFEQHKLSVCIEKKNGMIKIYLIDPMSGEFNPEQANFDDTPFMPIDLIFAYMKQVSFDPTKTFFFISSVERQHGEDGGCSTFALRDAINFLKDPDFHRQCVLNGNRDSISLPIGSVYHLAALPAACMKSTQSITLLNRYFKQFPNRESLIRPSLSKHLVQLLDENGIPMKLRNHYIDDRTAKYQRAILRVVKTENDDEINRMIDSALLR